MARRLILFPQNDFPFIRNFTLFNSTFISHKVKKLTSSTKSFYPFSYIENQCPLTIWLSLNSLLVTFVNYFLTEPDSDIERANLENLKHSQQNLWRWRSEVIQFILKGHQIVTGAMVVVLKTKTKEEIYWNLHHIEGCRLKFQTEIKSMY